MRLRPNVLSELWNHGLMASEDCGFEENQEFYQRVLDGEELPLDVWQIGTRPGLSG